MSDRYVLATDTCADLPADFVEAAGLEVLSFPYACDGEERRARSGDQMAPFYDSMRAGGTPTTSTIPLGDYLSCFRAHAEAGEELVFLAFSSGLSSSFSSALMARDTVIADYPGARIHLVDTLRASIAQGALVAEAVDRRDAGATADELVSWALDARERAAGYFTTETLEHLRRGGRVSDVAAAAGAMLDVRPVLTFDCSGGLSMERLVRGRRRSLRALAERVSPGEAAALRVLIGHADCPEDAERLETLVLEMLPGARLMRCEIGPVIGSHTGPGMVAVAFVGT